MQGSQNAAQSRKTEKAPLVGKTGKSYEDRFKPNESDLLGNYWILVLSWLKFTLCPGLLFSLFAIVFMLGYHTCPRILVGIACWLIVVLCIYACSLWMRSMSLGKELRKSLQIEELTPRGAKTAQEHPELVQLELQKSKTRKSSVCGFFCAGAILLGVLVGMKIHLSELVDYWSYNGKRHYTNVAPDEPAAAHSDASVLVFMDGSKPDSTRAMGYRRMGTVYCVAPVDVDASESDQNPSTDIQYWAVGKDCCSGQGFTCEGAGKTGSRSGMVLSKKTGMDAIGEGILSNDELHYYQEAVKMGLSKFDMTSPENRMFARFVNDIQKAHDAQYTNACWSLFYAQLFLAPLWMVAGLMTVLVGWDDYLDHIGDMKEKVLYNMNHVC